MDWLLEDPTRCSYLADLVVAVHFAVVAFVLGGAIMILLGGLRAWSWVRGPVFRLIHFGVVLVVALQQELCFIVQTTRRGPMIPPALSSPFFCVQ